MFFVMRLKPNKNCFLLFLFYIWLLAVGLAYSAQIVEDNTIPITVTDVPVDALVTANGVIPISPAALERL